NLGAGADAAPFAALAEVAAVRARGEVAQVERLAHRPPARGLAGAQRDRPAHGHAQRPGLVVVGQQDVALVRIGGGVERVALAAGHDDPAHAGLARPARADVAGGVHWRSSRLAFTLTRRSVVWTQVRALATARRHAALIFSTRS